MEKIFVMDKKYFVQADGQGINLVDIRNLLQIYFNQFPEKK